MSIYLKFFIVGYLAFGLGFNCAWDIYESHKWPQGSVGLALVLNTFLWPISLLIIMVDL